MANKAVFLDRDDTIIRDPGYISSAEQVRLLDGAGAAMKQLSQLGYKLIVVTNQSGIARGLLNEQQLDEIHKKLKHLLALEGAFIDGIYYCPFHPEGVIEQYRKESDMRKPNAGMILKAAEEMNIDLASSWMVGNSKRDVEAGNKAGCRTIIVQPSVSYAQIKYTHHNADFTASNMKEVVNIIKWQSKQIPTKQDTPTTANIATNSEQEKFTEKKQEPEMADKTQTIIDVPKSIAQPQQDFTPTATGKPTKHYLHEILQLLKAQHRDRMFSDFSGLMIIGGILQIIVLLLIVGAIWFVVRSASESAYMCLSFATVFQLIVMTIYIMHQKR